jgi:hypothetical protein
MVLYAWQGHILEIASPYWDHLLSWAIKQGWRPAGTLPPAGQRAEDWSGDYAPAEGQYVTAEDAMGLAAALRVLHAPNLPEADREAWTRLVAFADSSSGFFLFPVSASDSLWRLAHALDRAGAPAAALTHLP